MQAHTSSLTDIGHGGCEAFLFQEAQNQGKTGQKRTQPNRHAVRTGGYGLGEKVLLVPVKAPAVGKPMNVAIRLAVGLMDGWFHCAANDPARQGQAGVLNLGNNGTQAGSDILSLFINRAILRVSPSTDLLSGYAYPACPERSRRKRNRRATLTRPTVSRRFYVLNKERILHMK